VLNVIDFLERFGQDAGLRHAPGELIEVALQSAGIDPGLRAAIIAKDQRALEALLGVNTNVCCLVHKEEDEEEEDDTDEDEDEDDEDDFDEDEDEDEDDEDDDEDEDDDDEEVDVMPLEHVA
jgi:hypothetical protein